ncbi:MAG TPA: threonine synthase [Chthonomonadales bacterium]|nr:threonine synthase [Chthonomonadales bacterium]
MVRGVIERFRERLPVSHATPVVSLLEGDTPLIEAPRLAAWISPNVRLFLKLEGLNPTGSFKDRGMTVAISKAAEAGVQSVICASTGNTSASAAAYAARAGMHCYVLIPAGKIAQGKLAQALMHGARVLAVEGNFDDALRLVREVADTHPVALVNSLNPYRIQGQKTAAFEIVEALGCAPDLHALAVGNAGNITAYWLGYREECATGRCARPPRMLGFQAWGAAPIVDGAPVDRPETIATAIRIGNPASWAQAEAARDESGGMIDKVTDAQILEAYRALAQLEGVFVEPSSATPVAGLRMLGQRGFFGAPCTVAATLTGHGLKDPDTAVTQARCEPESVAARPADVLRVLGM